MTLLRDAEGTPYLAGGSPHAYGARAGWLYEALRRDLGPVRVEPARSRRRVVPRGQPFPYPEACPPHQDAANLGLTLFPRLPLLFVKTRRGELLPDARTALAYARENEADFADVLAVVETRARDVLDPEVVARSECPFPAVYRDLVQRYETFGTGFFAIPCGFYVQTDPGVGTMLGPPINRTSKLSVRAGLIETDWHHHGLFVVTEYPAFEGRSLLVLPEEEIAQLYFVAYRALDDVVIHHSFDESGGETAYEAHWSQLATGLAQEGKGSISRRTGVASVRLDCLHCRVSVTRAAEGELPHGHEIQATFVGAYRWSQLEQRRMNHE